jgi:polyisoprenoid-binding protein YceI
MGRTLLALIAASFTAAGFAASQPSGVRTFDVDPANSTATIEVGKSGPLSFVAGHAHEVDAPGVHGTIRVAAKDAGVDLTEPVLSMKVSGEHESADDRPKIQQTMMSAEVLDAEHHPSITFRSTSVVIRSQTATALDAVVDGRLTIRGETRTVSVPVHADLSGRMLTAAAHFTIRQSDYGIKPVSVAGVVAVKDELVITLHIVGRERD